MSLQSQGFYMNDVCSRIETLILYKEFMEKSQKSQIFRRGVAFGSGMWYHLRRNG